MTDFLLDEFGDLDMTSGLQLTPSYDIEAAQRLRLALGINLGEFFAYATFGLPYIKLEEEDFATNIRYMLGDKFPDSSRFVYNTLTEFITSLSYIESVDASYEFNAATRVFTYYAVCYLVDGGVITAEPFVTTLES